MAMNSNQLADLLKKKEDDKLEFKSYWYKDDVESKNELVKDIIALANGSIASIGKNGTLIIGFDEKLKKPVDIIITDPKGTPKKEDKLRDEITQLLKNYTNKPLKFDVFYHKIREKNIVCIIIESHSYLIYLNKELKTPKSSYNKGALLYRENAIVEVASNEIRNEFEKNIDNLNRVYENKTTSISPEQIDIKIEARDILNLIVSPRDIRYLSDNKGTKASKEDIHYEYYMLERKGVKEGYLFLGKAIINKNVFQHFNQRFRNDLPKSLEIFLLKEFKEKDKETSTKKRDNIAKQRDRIVDKKKDIFDKVKEYKLTSIVGQNIHYFDDVIWENTITKHDSEESYQRQDFIDQRIYKITDEENAELLSMKSVEFFFDELDDPKTSSLSVVFGSGGVGKTTFCDALNHKIIRDKNIRKKVFYIKGERIAQFFLSENKEIKSLEDLYELYKEDSSDFNDISPEYFRLNFISGNIVVIIDAIEEIESALNERFDLKLFFQSLKSLHDRFLSTKIIVTTREHFLPKIKKIESVTKIAYYQLQGFDEANLKDFLAERYKTESGNIDSVKIRQVNNFINENNLFHDGHIIPLFVDWVCQIIDRPEYEASIESKYFFISEKIDRLLINLLKREIKKQSLNIDIDGMFLLLEDIVIQYNGSISEQDFNVLINCISNQHIENYIKNPLFKRVGDRIQLKYDILSNFIKSRCLHHALVNREITQKVSSLLKDCYQGQGDIFLSLVTTLSKEQNVLKDIVKQFITNFNRQLDEEKSKESDKEKIRKSISALLYILNTIEKPKDKQERMQLIREIYSTNTVLKRLCIYGDFEALDFNEITIQDGYFDGYRSFNKCNFPLEDKKVFFSTKFKNFRIPQTKGIKKVFFDTTCEYINCNINEITMINTSKETQKTEQIRKDVASIASYIETSQRSLNKIKQNCKITYPKGLKSLLTALCDEGFLRTLSKANRELFEINSEFYDDIPSIKIGNFSEKIEHIIEKIL